jgi:small GTP-binding protein
MPTIQKKVCLLGDYAVGKTSLVRQFVEGRFDDKYLSTVGVKISRKVIERDGYNLNLLIWDLAGGEDFDQVSQRYLLGAVGALVVCDLTRPETLDLLAEYAHLMRVVNPETALVLAGNKVDLVEKLAIDESELAQVANSLRSPWLLTSAKTGERVDEGFQQLANQIEAQ